MILNRLSDNDLPGMKLVEQRWPATPALDIESEVEQAWSEIQDKLELPAGGRVAVCVGSRGVANLAETVRAIAVRLKQAGVRPFITPAMGSHGGATIEGQVEVLAARGVTAQTVGAPVEATMDVVPLDQVQGIPLFVDRLAFEADGLVVINRIKPHTNFFGPTESGLLKMLAIGLGNQAGAEHYHRLTMIRDYYEVLSTAGRGILKRCNVLFGVGLVENQEHITTAVHMALAEELENMEIKALENARALMPGLPVDDIDLLIVDEMGKDISGMGIDPNVVGRDVCACGMKRPKPMIHRILVRDLTEASEGSALGVGQADFTVRRLVEKINHQVTSINCLTCCCPESGRVPLTYDNDRQALAAALMTLRPYTPEDLKLVHIKNTLELKHLLLSQGLWSELQDREDVVLGSKNVPWKFDENDEMISPLIKNESELRETGGLA